MTKKIYAMTVRGVSDLIQERLKSEGFQVDFVPNTQYATLLNGARYDMLHAFNRIEVADPNPTDARNKLKYMYEADSVTNFLNGFIDKYKTIKFVTISNLRNSLESTVYEESEG